MSDRRRKRQTYREEQKDQGAAPPARQVTSTRPQWAIQAGWKVYTADNAAIGNVGEVAADDGYFVVRGGFLLRRHTLYVPVRVVRGSGNGNVMLRATKAEALTWKQAPSGRRRASAGAGD